MTLFKVVLKAGTNCVTQTNSKKSLTVVHFLLLTCVAF